MLGFAATRPEGIQTLQRIPLNTITLSINTPKVYTSQGVAIGVVGTAQVKINGSNEEMLRYAAEQFGSKGTHFDIQELDQDFTIFVGCHQ